MTDAARRTSLAGIALAALMAATRVHPAGAGDFFPDASLAVFFLAGLALASPLWLGAFLVEAVMLDAWAIGIAHVPAVCLTWGYAFLLPAYCALWLAGRGAAAGPAVGGFVGGLRLGALLLAGVVAYFVLSNLGYFLGGGFAATTGVAGYAETVAHYFPAYFAVAGAYVAGALAASLAGRRLGVPHTGA
ncbi:MAG TPA: hypothetical protein VHD15_03525 [Hyphomicrobiales bacterium]|nr:hypothetical protein [Hyphomicrobiales bacterium]